MNNSDDRTTTMIDKYSDNESNVKTRIREEGETDKEESKKRKVSHNKPTKPKKDPLVIQLRRSIQECCRTNDLSKALEFYQNSHLRDGVILEAQSFYNLLSLCDGHLGEDRPLHVGTPRTTNNNNHHHHTNHGTSDTNNADSNIAINDSCHKSINHNITPDERKSYALQIQSEMQRNHIPLNESANTALIRILILTHDHKEAENVLTKAHHSSHCKPKLRMYSSLFTAYCDSLDIEGSLRIWALLSTPNKHTDNKNSCNVTSNNMVLGEKEYCALMKCATKLGDVKVMERILSDLAEDILVPSLETTDVIIKWFESNHSIIVQPSSSASSETDDVNSIQIDEYLKINNQSITALEKVSNLPISEAPTMGPIQYLHSSSSQTKLLNPIWEINRNITLDSRTGSILSGCLAGHCLKPVALSSKAWNEMMIMNESIVLKGEVEEHSNVAFAGGGKGKKVRASEKILQKRTRDWEDFKSFLDRKRNPHIGTTHSESNVVSIDSTTNLNNNMPIKNHHKKVFDVVIDGANVGYYKQNFANAPKHVDYNQIDWIVQHFLEQDQSLLLVLHERHFAPNLMPRWAEPIVKKWDASGVLYRAPYGSNDDWFWIHAALFSGVETMVVSNDEMRDHHFQMLAYRSFLRWKERHQVYFDFGLTIRKHGPSGSKRREVILTYPDVYSRRIQKVGEYGLVVPLPKRGDENRFLDGVHVAGDDTPINETYVTIGLIHS